MSGPCVNLVWWWCCCSDFAFDVCVSAMLVLLLSMAVLLAGTRPTPSTRALGFSFEEYGMLWGSAIRGCCIAPKPCLCQGLRRASCRQAFCGQFFAACLPTWMLCCKSMAGWNCADARRTDAQGVMSCHSGVKGVSCCAVISPVPPVWWGTDFGAVWMPASLGFGPVAVSPQPATVYCSSTLCCASAADRVYNCRALLRSVVLQY